MAQQACDGCPLSQYQDISIQKRNVENHLFNYFLIHVFAQRCNILWYRSKCCLSSLGFGITQNNFTFVVRCMIKQMGQSFPKHKLKLKQISFIIFYNRHKFYHYFRTFYGNCLCIFIYFKYLFYMHFIPSYSINGCVNWQKICDYHQ